MGGCRHDNHNCRGDGHYRLRDAHHTSCARTGDAIKLESIIERPKKIGAKGHEKKKEYSRSSVALKIYRANRPAGQEPHYDTVEVPVQRWTTVLDALLYAKSYKDSSIGIRYSCRMASCGSCGMKINGIPRLACYTKVSELEG